MNSEQLLQMLREAKLDDEAIKKLLSDTLANLKGPTEEPKPEEPEPESEEKEKEEAEKIFGVNL